MATQSSSSADVSGSFPVQQTVIPSSSFPSSSFSSSSLQLPYPTLGTKRSPSPSASLLSSSSSDSNLHAHTITVTEGPPAAKKKRMFHRELRFMMHGFGDDPNPYSETVDLVEDLVVEFITEMTLKVMEVGKSGKVHVNDIIFLIRKDPKKYRRVKELLMMNEELKKARKAFDDTPIDPP